MAITSKATLQTGLQRNKNLIKTLTAATVTRWWSSFYAAGIPAAAVAPTPGLAGAALTSYGGQIPFENPVSGNAYLASIVENSGSVAGSMMMIVADRLWHNSGFTITITTAQTVNSVAWPARDANASTNGEGVYIGVEVSGATGAGTPTLTMSYTNQAGTAGRTATNVLATIASAAQGSFWVLGLQAGDTGVRSVQSFTLSATWTSGTIHLVAFRILAMIPITGHTAGLNSRENAISLGMPRMYNDSVPFFLTTGPGTASTMGLTLGYAHG